MRAFTSLVLAILLLAGCVPLAPQVFAPNSLIADVWTDKARYNPGQPVAITVMLNNQTAATFSGDLVLSFFHVGTSAGPDIVEQAETLKAGETREISVTWAPPATDFVGYRVEVQARQNGTTRDMAATAVDVSSDWAKFPRYGFVSKFGTDVDPDAVIKSLNIYHINGLQFYDWQWQHHRPYSPEAQWPDIANRPVVRETVTGLIDAAHKHNMLAMNYNLAFGGFDNYWQDGSDAKTAWGLFKNKNNNGNPEFQDFHPLPEAWATQKLFLFDPNNREWQQFIFAQEQQVFDHFAFDGWHIDTLGKRGGIWNAKGEMVSLANGYADFTNNAKSALGKRMVFNTVGTYGQDQIASQADVDFVYSELWETDGAQTYSDIVRVVEQAKRHTDKAVVLPAYMNKGFAQSSGATGFFNEPGLRYANAAMFAAGASHLELGDMEGMLSSEYFPAQPLIMSDTTKLAMRDSYDFLVSYQNILRDGMQADDARVVIEGIPTSATDTPRSVWTLARSKPGYQVFHLVNLRDLKLNQWRDNYANYPAPTPLNDLKVKLYLSTAPAQDAKLFYATPDAGHGKAHAMTYTSGSDAEGMFISFTLPQLHYWDMIWLESRL